MSTHQLCRRLRSTSARIACVLSLSLLGVAAADAQYVAEDPALQALAVEHYAARYHVTVEEAERRIVLQDRAAGIEDQLAGLLGSQFAAAWYEHDKAGRLQIGMTAAASRLKADVLRIVDALGIAADTDLVGVRYSMAELERIQDDVRRSLGTMITAGRARTSRNPKLNSIVVTAIHNLPATEEALLKRIWTDGVTLRRVAGSTLEGTLDTCTIKYCDPPLRGGRMLVPTFGFGCTAGFTARHRVHTNELLLMTAGHCIHFSGGFGTIWGARDEAQVWHSIGPVYGGVFGPRDAGVIHVVENYWKAIPPAAAVVAQSAPQMPANPNYKIRFDSQSMLGQTLCQSGAKLGTQCAIVSDLGADHVFGGVLLTNLGELDRCDTQYGDSGGPIFKSQRAFGLHVGHNNSGTHCYTMYQGIRGAENVLDVDILLAP